MATIRADIRDRVAHLGHGSTTGQALLQSQPLRRGFSFVHRDALAAETLTACIVRFPVAVLLTGITLVPGETGATPAATASDTLYGTLALTSEDGAGGGSAAVCGCTTKTAGSGGTGDWAKGVTIDASSARFSTPFVPVALAAGSILKLAQSKAGAGTALAYAITVDFELNG